MATFDEIFQNYVNYGFTRPTTPVPTVQGIESLATPMMTQPISDTSSVAENMAPTSTTTTGKSMGSLSMSDVGKIAGFMANPIGFGIGYGINKGVENMTGKSIAQQVAEAVNSMMGRSIGPTPGAEDGGGNPAASSDPDSQGDTGAATGGDGGGVGSSSDAGAADSSTEGSFAKGGRVGFADGTVIPFEKIKLFELVGEDLYGDWDTFSEVYDDYGAERMWKGISGRPGQKDGGIMTLSGESF